MSSSKSVTGGLLAGLGAGLMNRADNAERERLLSQKQQGDDVLQMRREAFETARALSEEASRSADRAAELSSRSADRSAERQDREADRKALREDRAAENSAQRDERNNELAGVVQDEEGNYSGYTRGGQKKDLGIKGPAPAAKGARNSDKSLSDEQLWAAVKGKHTTKGDLMNPEATDWNAAAQDFKRIGRPDLADVAMSSDDSGKDITVTPAYKKAAAQADQWVSGQAGWLTSDANDFKAYGGNREQARQKKTMEFYRALTSGAGGASDAGGAAAADDGGAQGGAASPTAAAKPSGGGSKADPFQATSQQHIDWFKANAPPGSVISVNGKLYTK
jgi:hypothetical protein